MFLTIQRDFMQQNKTNAFCCDGDGVIEKNFQNGVKYLRLKTSCPKKAEEKMKKFGMEGKLVLSFADWKRFSKDLSFETEVFVDLNQMDAKTLEEISLSKANIVLPLFDNLVRTGEINSNYGISPAKLAEDMGFLDRHATIIGGAYADKDDLEILGLYGTKVVICPRANAKKGNLMPNIVLMQKHGLVVSVGSDDYDEIDLNRECEMLYLSTLSMLENPNIVSFEKIKKYITGENL